MKFKKSLLTTMLLAPSIVMAEVNIEIPRGVQLMTVNGEDAGYSSLGFDYTDSLKLKDGVNQIVFRLAHVVRESGADKTKFKSKPLVATFDASDVNYALELPRVDTFDQGMKFNAAPTFKLIDSSGKEPASLKKDSINLGFKLMPDMVQEVEKYNMSVEVASLKHFEKQTKSTDINDVKPADVSGSSYDILRAAYENATPEEKKKFLTWAISNLD